MTHKYHSEKYFSPIRAGLPQHYKLFAPLPVYVPTAAPPLPQTAKYVMADDSFAEEQSFPINDTESAWGPWKAISSCRSGCLALSKGLRLVQRSCESGTCDSGPSRSVQLCIPNEQVFKFSNYIYFYLKIYIYIKMLIDFRNVRRISL